ncbi:MAG TPA: hypothetical protein VMK84_21615 [Streptosporangiaceae bacterium]|nr:hypothetical protein [Streptosporangiaceae bacterium]
MTETISPAESQAAELPKPPRLARPETDAIALGANEDATAHVREHVLKIRQNPQAHIQDCVDQILAGVGPGSAAS